MFILTLMYPKWEKHVQLGLASDRLRSPPASSLLSHTIWRTICECLAMQWGRLNCGYRIGPDTQTLEIKAHTSREIWEEERYILFIFYFCAVVHSRSDSKREEGRRGACAEHRKAAWRRRIRHLVTFPCVQKIYKLKHTTKWSNCETSSSAKNSSAVLWHFTSRNLQCCLESPLGLRVYHFYWG